jgi:predicted GNAT family N-acyltransferase
MHASLSHASSAPALASAVLFNPAAQPEARPVLGIRVLETPEERQEIAHLRKYADFRSEYELDPGLASLEAVKDSLGVVMGITLDDEMIATIRIIPTGHGVTLTERFWRDLVTEPEIFANTSWEVGRLVMDPDYRRADLLPRCMSMALVKLLEVVEVRHLHASCLASMTRLYRRFGMKTHALRSKSGKDCALIHGNVAEVCAALKVRVPSPVRQVREHALAEAQLLQ